MKLNSFYPRGTGIMFLLRTSCAETRTPIPVPAPPLRRNWRLRFTNIKTLLFFTITLRFQIRFVLATIVYFITDIVHKHPCNLLSVVNMFLTRHRRRKLTKALWKSVDTHRKRVLYVCGKYRKCVELTNLTVCGFKPEWKRLQCGYCHGTDISVPGQIRMENRYGYIRAWGRMS